MYTHPWNPVQPDGTYRNPIIFADYSDPDVIQHGSDFFLVSSSFNATPGLPILHSKNLVNWRIVNHAIKNLPHPRYQDVIFGSGVWAPSIRFHNGRFYIFIPMVEDGIYVTTASHPTDVWSEPYLLQAGPGFIDPCPFWDDDGLAYLVHGYARSRSGLRDKIHVRPMSPDCKSILGDGKIVFDHGEKHPYMEGPKVHKREGWYYIFAPAGGVPTGWQAVLRSKAIYGPYEDKIVLERGSTSINGPHQGALLELSNGQDWFIHFQDATLYGRIIHLQPVTWKDGWPMMGQDYDEDGVGEPVPGWKLPEIPGLEHAPSSDHNECHIPQTSDDFSEDRLGLQWQWNANHEDHWVSMTERANHLRFWVRPQPKPELQKCPALLLQKFPAKIFTVDTTLETHFLKAGERAGLIVVGNAYGALCLRRTSEGENVLALESAGKDLWEIEWPDNQARLRVEIASGGACTFSYHQDDAFRLIPNVFTAQPAEWIGARIGIFSAVAESEFSAPHGCADFGHFTFSGPV